MDFIFMFLLLIHSDHVIVFITVLFINRKWALTVFFIYVIGICMTIWTGMVMSLVQVRQGQEHNILHTVTLTQVVKPSVHDAGFSSVNRLDLVSPQRPSWQTIVVVLPALKTLEPDFGTTSQQPLCCSSVWTHSFDPFIVHPECRATNIQTPVHANDVECEGFTRGCVNRGESTTGL